MPWSDTSNQHRGKVIQIFPNKKMPICHFVTNRSIMMTNQQKIKTKPQGKSTNSQCESQNFCQEFKKNV